MSRQMIPIWTREDAAAVYQRAATLHATSCPAALVKFGERFGCDNPEPRHATHTSAALRARWVDEGTE